MIYHMRYTNKCGFSETLSGLVILVLFSFVFSTQVFAQQRLMDFLPKIAKNNYDLYGFKPFVRYEDKQQREEFYTINHNKKIVFLEYMLINKSASEKIDNYFTFRPESWAFESTGPEPIDRAVINLGFWGIKPLGNQQAVYVLPSVGQNLSIHSLFNDVLTEVPSYFTSKERYKDLHLLIINLEPKEGKKYKYFKNQLTILHSMFIYILWDKGVEPELPDFVTQNEYLDFSFPSSRLYDPGIVQLTFDNIPVPLNFSLENAQGERQSDTTSKYKLVYAVSNENTSSPSSPVKVNIEKPRGYNIVRTNQADTLQWFSRFVEISLRKPDKIGLCGKKLPAFQFIYIDPSGFQNTKRLMKAIKVKMEKICNGPYYLYLSHLSQPFVAQTGNDYIEVLQKIADLNMDTPMASVDIKNIAKEFNAAEVIGRTDIQFHLFLSKNMYNFSFDDFVKGLLNEVKSSQITFTIYLENDEPNKKRGFIYSDINKILKNEK